MYVVYARGVRREMSLSSSQLTFFLRVLRVGGVVVLALSLLPRAERRAYGSLVLTNTGSSVFHLGMMLGAIERREGNTTGKGNTIHREDKEVCVWMR